MNERIQALIDECTTIRRDMVYDGEDSYLETQKYFDKEKFAELIVKECAEVSKNYAGGSMPLSIALAIKEHFGVEE